MPVERDPAPPLRSYVRRYYGFRETTSAPVRRLEGPGGDVIVVVSLDFEWRIGDATNPARPWARRAYANDHEDRRHYFVMRIDGWKVDVSMWFAGLPPGVEEFQSDLSARLADESRLATLRLKEAWHRLPHYPA